MSRTIDERLVSMQFDNKHFESNVQTSISTLDKLKQSLNLTGASKGLEGIDKAAKNVNMSGLGNAVETVRAKFSALEVMGVTALANLTNSAVNAGKRIASSLTEYIRTGFAEYETQINAVQTILANTSHAGTTIDDVNKTLNDLNTYADKTIYNFTEMTRNIGTFTAAGLGLEESASAIKGIANLAAVSGSTSQQASTAMYQLSQALANGTVNLQDWNSVVNAGMGGKVFQDALVRTAAAMKGVSEETFRAENITGSFRESISNKDGTGWLSAEVLSNTLRQFTGDLSNAELAAMGFTDKQIENIQSMAKTANDAATKVKTFTQLWDTLKESAQSGWAQSWEIIIGDFDEAKELFTEISDILSGLIGESAEARNKVLQGWKDAGGRTAIIESLRNAFEGIRSIVTPISEAFREIFPPITAKQLVAFSEALKNLTAKLKLSDEQSAKLKSTFKGLFAAVDIVVTIVKEVARGIIKLLGNITGLGSGILSITSSFGDWISGLRDTIKETNVFGSAVDKITTFLQKVIDKIKEFVAFIGSKIKLPGFEGFLKVMQSIWGVLQKITKKIVEVGSAIGHALTDAFRNGDISSGLDIINGGIFAAILLKVKKFMGGITDAFDGAGGFLENITGILDGVKGCLESWQQSIKAGVLLKIASAIGILAVALLVISSINQDKLTSSLGAITVLFADLMGSLFIFDKIGGEYKKAGKAVTAMIGMSVAVLILASALKKLSDLSWDELGRGIAGVAGLTIILVGAAKIMSKGSGKVMKGATSLILFASAIKILASACTDLSNLSWGELTKGLVGVGILMAEVAAFLKVAKMNGKTVSTATGIVVLSAAIKILASACKDFGAMSVGDIIKGLSSIAALLAEIVIFTKLTGNAKKVISTGVAMIAIGAAMKILASSVKDFSDISWSGIARGLLSMAGALTAIVIAVKLMPKNLISIGLGMIVVGAAMKILASALSGMSIMSWDEVARGLTALGGAIGILAIGLNAMRGTLAASAAMLVATMALGLLTPVLKSLGSMGWGDIAKGLIAIAGAFTIIGIAGYALGPVVPAILGISGAIALLGVACLAMGAGVALFAAGMTALSVAGAAGAAAIVSAITIIVVGILDLIPAIIDELTKALVSICQVIIQGAPAIGEAIKALVLSIVDVLVECVPAITDGALKLIVGVLDALVKYTPQIVDSIFQFLIEILEGVARNLPQLIQSIVNVIMALFKGVVDALSKIDPAALLQGVLAVGLMAGLMAALAAVAAMTPAAMAGVLGMGVVVTELALVLAAIGAIAQIPGLDWLINEGGQFLQTVGTAIGQFLGGIVGGFAKGMSAALPQIGADLSAFMKNAMPFIQGAKSFDASAMEGVQALAGVILTLTATNILDGITSWLTGGSSLVKFGMQLAPFGKGMKAYSDAITGFDAEAVVSSANAAKALSELANNLPNSGGLAGILAGENDIGSFGKQLIPFGKGMKSYSDAISGFDAEAVVASANAAKAIAEMSNHIPNSGGVVSWFAGDNSISQFGDELKSLGEGLKGFSDAVVGVNPENLVAIADAAKVLVDMTNYIPNEGGVVSWFAGDNSIAKFGDDLVELGKGLKGFSEEVDGVSPEAIIAASGAAKALTDMANCVPNSGGMVTWFTGDNSIAQFGDDLVKLGKGLKGFSDAITGMDSEAVITGTKAAKSLAKMASYIPNSGGVVSWFAGDNSVAQFGDELKSLGKGLKGFSDEVSGVNAENLTAATSAAKALAEMASHIPNSGGMVTWFTGDNSIANFGDELKSLGEGLKGFSDSIVGINTTNLTAAAGAAKSLADMTSHIPNSGGVASWFTGESSISKFGGELTALGKGLKGFSDAVVGVKPETMTAAANAGKTLAEMTNVIPNEGGISAWFAGEKSISKFSTDLIALGKGLKGFSDAVVDVKNETMTTAANAGKTLADMVNTIPNEGGINAWFAGEKSVSKFSTDLVSLGKGLKGFSDAVTGVKSETMTAAANAGKTLAEMVNVIPNSGGIGAWFAGEKSISKFGTEMVELGKALKGFSDAVVGVKPESMTAAANSAKTLADMTNTVPDNSAKLIAFGENLKTFGGHLKTYFTSISGISLQYVTTSSLIIDELNKLAKIDSGKIRTASDSISDLVSTFKEMSSIKSDAASGFVTTLSTLAKSSIDEFAISFDSINEKMSKAGKDCVIAFVKAVDGKAEDFSKAGQTAMKKFADGITNSEKTSKSAINGLVGDTASAITAKQNISKFTSAGADVVRGFANGISNNTYLAEAKSRAMAAAAARAAKEELDEHSPSRVFYDIGAFAGIALVNALGDYTNKAEKAGGSLARASVDGLKRAISRVTDIINSDIDTQPTIRPVLDLSNIESGASAIGGMLGGNRTLSVDTSAVGAISASMSRAQNGGNSNEIVSAIKALRKDISNLPRSTTNVNGITYDDGSNVSTAVQTLIRAAKIERRT